MLTPTNDSVVIDQLEQAVIGVLREHQTTLTPSALRTVVENVQPNLDPADLGTVLMRLWDSDRIVLDKFRRIGLTEPGDPV